MKARGRPAARTYLLVVYCYYIKQHQQHQMIYRHLDPESLDYTYVSNHCSDRNKASINVMQTDLLGVDAFSGISNQIVRQHIVFCVNVEGAYQYPIMISPVAHIPRGNGFEVFYMAVRN